MTSSKTDISVVISSGGRGRLHLLDAMLARVRHCRGVSQLIISDIGDEPQAVDLARRWDADYLFTLAPGQFDRARALNMGSQLAQHDVILWSDGDLLFGEHFLPQALEELRANDLDYLWPFSGIAYLSEPQSREVMAGERHPADCPPIYIRRPLSDNAGAMGMVTRDFLRRNGGMIEGFRGWGAEDNAWAHKAALLGKARITQRKDQPVWHLYHADSGSHSATANRLAHRRNPSFEHNMALLESVCRIHDPAEMMRQFPPVPVAQPPWRTSSRIIFVTPSVSPRAKAVRQARDWARKIQVAYGWEIPIATTATHMPEAADLVVAFTEEGEVATTLSHALEDQRAIIVLRESDEQVSPPILADGARHMILAQRLETAMRWHQIDQRVWHRGWDADNMRAAKGAMAGLPAIVQILGYVLGQPRTWKLRIALDRSALPRGATDRPAFWYVAFHDGEGAEVARVDANPSELAGLLARPHGQIVLERTVRTARMPMHWTIWPVDRRRQWLEKISGAVTAHAALSEMA